MMCVTHSCVWLHNCLARAWIVRCLPVYTLAQNHSHTLSTCTKKMEKTKVLRVEADDELDRNELMVEVDLGDRCLFHSLFACPILRRENTEPMRLRCGHVISKEAEDKLRAGMRLKCPYCPDETLTAEATRLYFS
eukprot:scpid93716/ scgid34901/ Protein RMD5 homolog A